jgi:hypothetical protein
MSSRWAAAAGILSLVLAIAWTFLRTGNGLPPAAAPAVSDEAGAPADGAVATPTPAATPAGVRTDFPFLEDEAWKQIDRAAQARPDPRDFEGLPRELAPVTAILGRIATALREDPTLVPQGIAFYRECAQQSSDLYSVRAVCLRDLKYWETQSGARDDSDSLGVPPEVARIVRMLPQPR